MNDVDSTEKRKKRLKIYYSLLITVVCIIGVSYAWFKLYLSQSENNIMASRTCFDVSLTEDTSKIDVTDAYPLTDKAGLKETPFTFTLKNNCSTYIKAYITIDSINRTSTSSSYLNDNYIKVNLSSKDTTDGTSYILGELSLTDLEDSRKGYIVKTTYLEPNEEKSFDLRVWMNSTVTADQGINKSWEGKIVVLSEASKNAAPDGWYTARRGTLLAAIREDNTVTDTLTTPGQQTSDKKVYNQVDFDSVKEYTEDMTDYQNLRVVYGSGYKINDNGYFELTGDNIVSDIYANIYSDLAGKYYSADYSGQDQSLDPNNLVSIGYVIEATADSLTDRWINSPELTFETISEEVLASTEDDYGTSYYFRGAVKNNYVEFANKCWRIVRVTGDGSIKLVLHNDNTGDVSNPCSSSNNSDTAALVRASCGTTSTTFNKLYTDNGFVGFMYGDLDYLNPQSNNNGKFKIELLNLSREEEKLYSNSHANINKSNIMKYLEDWYISNNFTDYESYLADTIWCNDKSTVTKLSNGSKYGNGLGYGQSVSAYGTYNRIFGIDPPESYNPGLLNPASIYASPSLICNNDNNGGKLSKFTVSDTINGNGDLTYKVGLLTADEVAYAGAVGTLDGNSSLFNNTYYLYENTGTKFWWTMSPLFTTLDSVISPQMAVVGRGVLTYYESNDSNYVRPSIALSSSTKLLSGTGTSEDPYVITEFVKGKNDSCPGK